MTFSDLFFSQPAQSFWFGILSSLALPLGALSGIFLRPGKRTVAAIMSFGAGVLLAVLAFGLVFPAAEHSGFWPVAAGAIAGGLLFVVLNSTLNGQGAFLRKPATAFRYLITSKKKRIRTMVRQLSGIKVFRALEPDEIIRLIPCIRDRNFEAGTVIFNQGETGDSFYLIAEGSIDAFRDGVHKARIETGDSFGEMSLLSGEPRNATLKAVTPVRAWQIMKDDFDLIIKESPRLHEALKQLSVERSESADVGDKWSRTVERNVDGLSITVSDKDTQEAAHALGGAAFAIWLGMLLDGIPEAAIIGATIASAKVSVALVAGIFIANFPEAMSSSAGLRNQKVPNGKIMWLWGSLTIMSGFCSLLGNVVFTGASPLMYAVFESCAAGAMLVVVAETMLPEAYQQGGSIVGMSTLFGFLSGLLLILLGK
jgi:zinc transporter ZupT